MGEVDLCSQKVSPRSPSDSIADYYTQDSANARLSLCATPYFALIPAIIILGIAIDAAIGRFLWRWRPKWTQPFVAEKVDNKQDLPLPTRHKPWGWTITLSTLSVIALASETTQLVVDGVGATAVILLVSWVKDKKSLRFSRFFH